MSHKTAIKGDLHPVTRALFGLVNGLHLILGGGDGLLADNIATKIKSLHNINAVNGINGCYNYSVGLNRF